MDRPERIPAEITEFAEHLRELKERSGRSYGTLAARLHVGASTLHRYCHGQAVPAGYAPVERMARLCGATPSEQVELHRRWLLAYAARARTETDPGLETDPNPDPETGPAATDAVPQTESPRRALRRPRVMVAALAVVAVLGGAVVAADLATGSSDRTAAPETSVPTDPLAWSADSHVWAHGCDHRYLIDRAPAAVPSPPVAQDARQWASALGAVHGGSAITQVTVRAAPGAGPVVVQELFVRVAERRDPLPWNAYAMSNGCGGALTPARYEVDLDDARPTARPVEGADGSDASGDVEPLPPRPAPVPGDGRRPVGSAGRGEHRALRLRLVSGTVLDQREPHRYQPNRRRRAAVPDERGHPRQGVHPPRRRGLDTLLMSVS